MRAFRILSVVLVVGSLALAGCGDDDAEDAESGDSSGVTTPSGGSDTTSGGGGDAGSEDVSGDLCETLGRVDYISSWQPETFEDEAASVEAVIVDLDAELQASITLVIDTQRASIMDSDPSGLSAPEFSEAMTDFTTYYQDTCQ